MRLPRCDSPTIPIGNVNPDDGFVGLPHYDSHAENDDGLRLPQCDSPTALGEIVPLGCRAVVPRQPQSR